MAKVKTLRVPNQCRCARSKIPGKEFMRRKSVMPQSAIDLCECQVWTLFQRLQLRTDICLADCCSTTFGFDPTVDDREHLDWLVQLHPVWTDTVRMRQIGFAAWHLEKYGEPAGDRYPVLIDDGCTVTLAVRHSSDPADEQADGVQVTQTQVPPPIDEFRWIYGISREPWHRFKTFGGGKTLLIDTRSNTVLEPLPYHERTAA